MTAPTDHVRAVTPHFDLMEALTNLRYLRTVREGLRSDKIRFEERFKGHGDGPTQGALLALATELNMLDRVIAQLWQAVAAIRDDPHI